MAENNQESSNQQSKEPSYTLNLTEQGKPLISESRDRYVQSMLKGVNLKFPEANSKDLTILAKLFQQIYTSKVEAGETTLGDCFTTTITFAGQVQTLSNNSVKNCKIHFKKGDEIDTGTIVFDLEQRPHKLYCKAYSELGSAKNQLDFGYQLTKYHPRLESWMNGTRVGYQERWNKGLSGYYFQQDFHRFQSIDSSFRYSQNSKALETGCKEQSFKHSFTMKHPLPGFLNNLTKSKSAEDTDVDLISEDNTHSVLFQNSCVLNPENLLYLKLSQKARSNKLAASGSHSSAALISNALGEDLNRSIKVGLKATNISLDTMFDHWLLKASTELQVKNTNGIANSSDISNDKLLRSKVFARYVRPLTESFYLTCCADAGIVHSLGKGQKVGDGVTRVNDMFYLPNFKGIKNVGYYFDPNAKKKGLGGDILGFDKYASFQAKVSQGDFPYLESQGVDPFVYANVALVPNRAASAKAQAGQPDAQTSKVSLRDYLRASVGFGATMRTSFLTLECYYNVWIKKQGNEFKNDFQINIGLD